MNLSILKRLARCAVVLILGAPSLLAAQNNANKDDKACEQAAKIVAKVHPEKKEESAFLILTGCGASAANAFATGIAQYTHETDIAALDVFMSQVDNWIDSGIMTTAAALATNSAASPEARVFAVRYLLVLVRPYNRFAYAGLTVGDVSTTDAEGSIVTTTGCRSQMGSERADQVGTPLPADYADRIRQTLTRLAGDATAPAVVRNAARCLH
jgi:hypothetical protein